MGDSDPFVMLQYPLTPARPEELPSNNTRLFVPHPRDAQRIAEETGLRPNGNEQPSQQGVTGEDARLQDFIEALSWKVTANGLSVILPASEADGAEEVEYGCKRSWRVDEMEHGAMDASLLCVSSEHTCIAVVVIANEENLAEQVKHAMRQAWHIEVKKFSSGAGGGFLHFRRIQHNNPASLSDTESARDWRLRWFRKRGRRLESFESPVLSSEIAASTYLELADLVATQLASAPSTIEVETLGKRYLLRAPTSLVAQARTHLPTRANAHSHARALSVPYLCPRASSRLSFCDAARVRSCTCIDGYMHACLGRDPFVFGPMLHCGNSETV